MILLSPLPLSLRNVMRCLMFDYHTMKVGTVDRSETTPRLRSDRRCKRASTAAPLPAITFRVGLLMAPKTITSPMSK